MPVTSVDEKSSERPLEGKFVPRLLPKPGPRRESNPKLSIGCSLFTPHMGYPSSGVVTIMCVGLGTTKQVSDFRKD